MRQSKLFRWAAALTLSIALAPGAASAQGEDTLTISSAFNMDWMYGTLGPDLAEVYANGHEHTWTLTLHGTSHSHHTSWQIRYTTIHATSFDLEFFGPDAATLNGLVSEHIAGGEVRIDLWNTWFAGGFMHVWVWGRDVVFWTGHETFGSGTPFPTDANGYPVLGPESFSIWSEYSLLEDNRSGNNGAIWSDQSLLTIEGSMGEPNPGEPNPGEPVVLAVADGSVLEGQHGFTTVAVAVTLSSGSSQAITVQYWTVDGTAKAGQDYVATSGTLMFEPYQTSRTIPVSIKGDRRPEADETFFVQLSNAVGATIGAGVATMTILNDD